MRALLTEYMCCFVKSEWKGMNIPPLKLEFKDDVPERMFCKPRPILPRLFEAAKKAFEHMLTYFYEPSNSAWASI